MSRSAARSEPAPGELAAWVHRGAVVVACALGTLTVYLLVALPLAGDADVQTRLATGLFVVGMVALTVTGSLLAARPRPLLAALLMATGLLGLAGRLVVGVALLWHDEAIAGARWVGWVTNWCWVPGQAAALVLLLRFPTGRLPGRRWNVVEKAIVVWACLTLVTTALVPGPLGVEVLEPLTNPVGPAAWQACWTWCCPACSW